MKNALLLFGFGLMSSPLWAQVPTGYTAWYKFNNNLGDESTNNNTANTGGPAANFANDRNAVANSALDTKTIYAKTTDGVGNRPNTDSLTVASWVYLEHDTTGYWSHYAINKPSDNNAACAFNLQANVGVTDTVAVLYANVRTYGYNNPSGLPGTYSQAAIDTILFNQWTHIAFTYARSYNPGANSFEGTVKLYINGVLKQTATKTFSVIINPPNPPQTPHTNAGKIWYAQTANRPEDALHFGQTTYANPAPINWTGNIDDAIIYGKTLSDAEIMQLYSGLTAVREMSQMSKLAIYPNPASDVATIEVPSHWVDASVRLSLYTMEGKLVQQVENITSSNYQLSLDNLSAGMYWVHLQDSKGNTAATQLAKK